MAKIKSTLDIVMERTRNLTMTQEDRDALRKKELADKIRGWVQLLVDGKYSVSNLKAVYSEESAHSPEAKDILRLELLGHIDPDTDNSSILDAWKDTLELDSEFIAEAIRSYRSMAEKGMRECRERLRGDLARSGISGAAVIPNVRSSPEWESSSAGMKRRFRQSLLEG